MKIDQNRANLDHRRVARTDAVRDERAAAAEKAAQDDRVSRPGAGLDDRPAGAAAAAPTANEASDIRPDAVARGRELLDGGELGAMPDGSPTRSSTACIDKG